MGVRSLLLLLACASLTWSLQIGNGALWEDSFVWAAMAFVALLVGVLLGARPLAPPSIRPSLALLWTAVLGLQVFALFRYLPGRYLVRGYDRGTYVLLLSAAALLMGMGLTAPRTVERWRLPLLLLVHAALGAWMLHWSPKPAIDVWVWHHVAMDGLLSGENPYAMTMPQIYAHTNFFGPGMVVDGRVQVGFVYPPLSLLLTLPGFLLGGDYRYVLLAAMTLAGGLMAYARPGMVGAGASALWLFASRSLFVLEQGWTEPLAVFLLALTALLAHRRSKWLFVAVGLLFAIKQYLMFAAPLLWLLPLDDERPQARWRLLGKAVAVAAGVTLPFFVVNPGAFLHSLVVFQLRQPFRADALSLPAYWFDLTGQLLPTSLAFLVLSAGTLLALWRCERSVSGFCAATAFIFFCFFVFSKQAFCNYYFLVLGALCLSMAFDSEGEQSDTSDAHVIDPQAPQRAT